MFTLVQRRDNRVEDGEMIQVPKQKLIKLFTDIISLNVSVHEKIASRATADPFVNNGRKLIHDDFALIDSSLHLIENKVRLASKEFGIRHELEAQYNGPYCDSEVRQTSHEYLDNPYIRGARQRSNAMSNSPSMLRYPNGNPYNPHGTSVYQAADGRTFVATGSRALNQSGHYPLSESAPSIVGSLPLALMLGAFLKAMVSDDKEEEKKKEDEKKEDNEDKENSDSKRLKRNREEEDEDSEKSEKSGESGESKDIEVVSDSTGSPNSIGYEQKTPEISEPVEPELKRQKTS